MLEDEILRVVADAGDVGVTAAQIAMRLGKRRESISHYLWMLKKMGKVTNKGRNLWVIPSEKAEAKVTPKPAVDPFGMPIDKFVKLGLNEYVSLSASVYELCRSVLKKAFRDKDVHHVVICDGRIVYTSSDVTGIPREEIQGVMERHGKPCYIFSREDLVEEVAWSRLCGGDYYPTVEVYLGSPEWTDSEVFDKGVKIVTDFDTGNPFYRMFRDEDGTPIVKRPRVFEVHSGMHLGDLYHFYPRRVKMGIIDAGENARCVGREVRFVLSWAYSPLVKVNPMRTGYVGRDLMMEFPFKVTLNPVRRSSTVLLL